MYKRKITIKILRKNLKKSSTAYGCCLSKNQSKVEPSFLQVYDNLWICHCIKNYNGTNTPHGSILNLSYGQIFYVIFGSWQTKVYLRAIGYNYKTISFDEIDLKKLIVHIFHYRICIYNPN